MITMQDGYYYFFIQLDTHDLYDLSYLSKLK